MSLAATAEKLERDREEVLLRTRMSQHPDRAGHPLVSDPGATAVFEHLSVVAPAEHDVVHPGVPSFAGQMGLRSPIYGGGTIILDGSGA